MAPINQLADFMRQIPEKISEWSVELMVMVYELCTNLILKTPLWIFDNQWFEETTYQFSLLSIGLVSILTILEAMKRMLSGILGKKYKPMDMKDIMKRWFLVAGVTTAVPFLFQKAFQILNWISEQLISMGVSNMRDIPSPDALNLFDIITLGIFDFILVGTVVPVLWKNGRRFFDIMVTGITTPFALTAWIFDSYRHLYNQWWNNLKHLSLVQVFYAFFLLVIGLFLFGTGSPDSFIGLIIKLLVVIGGFSRLISPPKMIKKHMDNKGGFDEVLGELKTITRSVKNNMKESKQIAGKPKGWAKKAWKFTKSKINK